MEPSDFLLVLFTRQQLASTGIFLHHPRVKASFLIEDARWHAKKSCRQFVSSVWRHVFNLEYSSVTCEDDVLMMENAVVC